MAKNEIIDFSSEADKLTKIIEEQIKTFKEVGDAITKAYKPLPSELQKQMKAFADLELKTEKLRQESLKTQKLVDDAKNREIKTLQAKEAQERKNLKVKNDFVNAMERQRKAQERTTAQQERANKVATEAARPYIVLQNKWREAQKTLADLTVSQGSNAKATQRARKEFEMLDKQIRSVDAITKNYSKNVGNYASAIGGNIGKLMGAFGVVGGITTGVAALKDAFNIIREFDSQMINVQKTTGLTNDELIGLKDSVVDLSKELGIVSSAKLGEYMAVAGQLGVKGSKDLLDFTSAMAQLETASTIAGEAGASEMARFLTLVDGGVQNVKAFGNEVVNLGNNFAATESEILSNATRIAQSTGVYNLGRQQVLAYATATKAVGVEAELVGSTMGRTLGIFEKSIRTGKNLESITKLLGVTQAELSERFKTDASSVLQDYIKALNNTYKAGGSVNAQLEAIGVTAIRDQAVISTLATKGFDTLQNAMIKVSEAGNAMGDEFDNASKKINNRIESLKTTWSNFILNIDKGDGTISQFVVRSINSLEKLITQLDRLNTSWSQIWESARTEGETLGAKEAEIFLASNKGMEDRMEAIRKTTAEVNKLEAEITELRKKEKDITEGSFLNKLTSKGVAWYRKDIEEKENYLGQYKAFIKAISEQSSKEILAISAPSDISTDTVISDKKDLSKQELAELKRKEEERLKIIFNTRKAELEMEIEHTKNIALINSNNKDEEQAVLLQYNLDRIKLIDLNYKEEQRLAKGNKEQLILAEVNYKAEIQKIEDETAKINKEALDKQYEQALTLANMIQDNDAKNAMRAQLLTAKTEQDKLNVRLEYIKKQKADLIVAQKDELKRVQENSLEELIIIEKFNQKRIELNAQADELIAQQAKKAEENVNAYLSKFTDMGNFGFSSLNIFTTIEDNGKTMFENLLNDAKDWKSKMAVIVGAVGEAFKDVMNAMQDASNARYENELAQLQASYEVSLEFAGDSAEAREKLEADLAEKQKALRRQKAKEDKSYAIMNAIINTAQAVVSMLAVGPWGIPLSVFAGAMGAVQIATIASTPIPEFWTGTDNAPQGLAWTQEKGAEVITDKKGNVKTMGNNKGAQLTWLESGDKVYKSRQDYFNRELNGMLASNNIESTTSDRIDYDRLDSIMSNNKSKVFADVNIDENGFNFRMSNRNNRQLNKNRNARR